MSGVVSVIPHMLFESARQELLDALAQATPGKIIWVIGPSGVGKSELRYAGMRAVAGNPSAWGRGHLPAVALRATLTDRNKFNPKDFALRLALSIRSPDLSWISPREAVESPDVVHLKSEIEAASRESTLLRMSTAEHELRREFELQAPLRQLKWIFIEEIASFLQVRRDQSPQNYMLGLMQLAEETQTVLVLIGTHAAAPLWDHNEELRTRTRKVWVRRYDERNPDHARHFASMVHAIGVRFPLASEDLLLANLELALLNSAGIFGCVFEWVVRAERLRRSGDRPSITLENLESATLSLEEQTQLWNSARAFDNISNEPPNLSLKEIADCAWIAAEAKFP
jgi:ABC-type hemin transport system ATPase subunit